MEMIHGGDIYSAREKIDGRIIDFSANINPLGIPQAVKDAIKDNIDGCEHYPDPLNRKLREAISAFEHIEKEYILCGNGSADIIFRLIYAIRPKKALILAPTFAEYECAMKNTGTEIDYFYLKEEDQFMITEDIVSYIKPKYDIMFLCNPNNPTGQIADPELMSRILHLCREYEILLVVDECFIDFLCDSDKYTLNNQLKNYDNLLILKAFTKTFAIPGIRLGYALCSNQDLLSRIDQSGQPWSVSVLAEKAGVAAFYDETYLPKTKEYIKQEHDFLTDHLKILNLRVYESKANYILFRTDDIIPLKQLLSEQGLLIRSCKNYNGLDEHYYRIAVKIHEENIILIEKMNEILI